MKYRAPHEIAAEIRAAKWSGKSLTDLEAEFAIREVLPPWRRLAARFSTATATF